MLVLAAGSVSAQEQKHLDLDSPFASFVEDDFPFFTQTLDCRKLAGDWPDDNLTPRGVILKPGGGYYVCFDIDLLRVALVWKQNDKGEYLSMSGMAPGSYRLPNRKASAGQKSLPVPLGTPLAANGLYPGWGKKVDTRDRKKADVGEVGLGPGKNLVWQGIEVTGDGGCVLKYRVGQVDISETWQGPERIVTVAAHKKPLTVNWTSAESETFPASTTVKQHRFRYDDIASKIEAPDRDLPFGTVRPDGEVKSNHDNGLLIEEVPLPLNNPWNRNVRLSALGFFSNGDAAVASFDGDVWIVRGMNDGLDSLTWTRFASGLHEPIGLEIQDDEIFVFSRNGIVRLHDRDDDGVADYYENFSSVVPQTAETREFANDIVSKPGGGFYLAKGGQVSSTKGIANGTVVEVSADGKDYKIICTGLRMPYIGVDPVSGMVTASDQQGNWKPTTPIHIIKRGEYYGFQPAKLKEKAVHPAPIDEPEIWIPHFVNQSGASQVWLRDAQMGPLDDALVHIGYNRPEIFQVYFDKDGDEVVQGAVSSLTHRFASGLLTGKVHPVDGSLWLTGFKIWGTSAEQICGLYRVTPDGGPIWTPANLLSEQRGVMLSFHQPVDRSRASLATSYSVDRWNYQRTHQYGSGHYQLDGEPGQETLPVASVKISEDGKSIFLGIPDMKPCHSLRVTYKIPDGAGDKVAGAFYTIHELRAHDLRQWGFGDNEVELTLSPEMLTQVEKVKPTARLGMEISKKYGCLVCHAAGEHVPAAAVAGDAQVAVGPPWNKLWGSKREFSDGTILRKTDEVYLKESILDPSRKVAKGFETENTGVGMPSYLGVLKDHEVESVILYIKSLK